MLELPGDVLRVWGERLAQALEDQEYTERLRSKRERRPIVAREMTATLQEFLNGELTIQELRQRYDTKTRNEWNGFGLGGLSGAMFLNQLVKHVPSLDELSSELRRALPVPDDAATALERMRRFFRYVETLHTDKVVAGTVAQAGRIPFFVSSWWHLQDVEPWPPFYRSARATFKNDGIYQPGKEVVDRYFQFREVFLAVSRELNIDSWEMDQLASWVDRSRKLQEPPVLASAKSPDERVWLVSPGRSAKYWEEFRGDGIFAIGWDWLGDLGAYSELEMIKTVMRDRRADGTDPTHNALACFQFAREMQPGDLIIAKKGRKTIVGWGRIASDYRFDRQRQLFKHVRSVDWQKTGDWTPPGSGMVTKTVTDIGKYPQLVADLKKLLEIDAEDAEVEIGSEGDETTGVPSYDIEQALGDVFLPRDEIEKTLALLRYRKNLVLQGPPGVGKTYFASRLAYLLMGAVDNERRCVVQFHQSYSYEDFVQGYRPTEDGRFALADGPFLRFCSRALQDSAPHVLIIDEINRGNLSKIFGELMLLIESDKRDREWAATLAYSKDGDQPFHVPPNLYIIGTMNTADRSLALVDYALRRRFAFYDVVPGFATDAFSAHMSGIGAPPSLVETIRARLGQLNEHIAKDPNLGDGFLVGHSYFCHAPDGESCDEEWFARIVETELAPLLREYWFDDRQRVDDAVAELLADE